MDTSKSGDSSTEPRALVPVGAGGAVPPPPAPVTAGDDDDNDGMLRMSFLEHLEEMRHRIIRMLQGLGLAFLACMLGANYLWDVVRAPAVDALTKLGINPPDLVITEPMENFSILWVKLPLLAALFVASPWVIYQVWAFISPGLYDKEKRMAVPFVLVTAGLFITGGAFAYFVAFRFGLTFLLGLGLSGGIRPMVTITSYFDLFVNVILGVSIVFELPVVIFFLTLLRIASPRFLMQHARYAILGIVILAAIITPTPDFFNLMLFAVPMCLLFFVGVFASHLLVLKREGKHFPWWKVLGGVFLGLAVLGGVFYFVLLKIGYHAVAHWPYMIK